MKVIDFEVKGNVIKLYFGNDKDKAYHGDDWDDTPYEHNAGLVYSEYIVDTKEYAFPFNYCVLTPESDWNYRGNSPFCKDDMKAKKCPCIIIKKMGEDDYDWDTEYSKLLGSKENDVVKIYFNDKFEMIDTVLRNFGAVAFPIVPAEDKEIIKKIADKIQGQIDFEDTCGGTEVIQGLGIALDIVNEYI